MEVGRWREITSIRYNPNFDMNLVIQDAKLRNICNCSKANPTKDIIFIRHYLTRDNITDRIIVETNLGVINNEEFREDTIMDED